MVDWLLDEGVRRFSEVLQRPLFGGSAAPDAARRVAALCRVLLTAARDRSDSGKPGRLQHALTWLQYGAPACLRWVPGLRVRQRMLHHGMGLQQAGWTACGVLANQPEACSSLLTRLVAANSRQRCVVYIVCVMH